MTTGAPSPLLVLRPAAVLAFALSGLVGVALTGAGGHPIVILNAFGVLGCAPLALSWAVFLAVGRQAPTDDRSELMIGGAALGLVCWAPVVLLTGLSHALTSGASFIVTAGGVVTLFLVVTPFLLRTPKGA
ncbi:MAG TPA: hypothetical protein VGE11_10385 [Pseudonocardia sp.]